MPDVGPLLASGRDADVFACGHDLVVRRSRKGRSMEREARVMSYLTGHGYPVPRVEDVRADGSELVMERIAGPTMLQALSRRPWTLGDNAALLATLHRRLHEIPAPDWLSPFPGGGDGIVHLDLHPSTSSCRPEDRCSSTGRTWRAGPVRSTWPSRGS